ncbi:hypothetical protein SH661x_001468 [Planctomicrobium sp. SH661]|uniref:hypothetical protein n=1 Tax=Planctomicrobium sp. SH661 TaxID=3448124 RepID=UPI003F5B5B1B
MAPQARHFVLLLLTLSSGCVTVGSPWNYTRSLLRRDKTTLPAEPASDPTAQEEEDDQPLIADAETTGAEAGSPGLKHDPGTRMLIEAELRDAAPHERAEWIAFLDTVETSEVAPLLQERRIATRRDVDGNADLSPSTGKVVPAAHSMTPETVDVAAASESRVSGNAPQVASTDDDAAEPTSADTATGSPWQKKIRSLADPNRLWNHSGSDGDEENSLVSTKPERGLLGIPQMRPSRNEVAAPPVTASIEPAAAAPVIAEPKQTAAIETRITPGSALWEDEVSKLISLLEAEVSASTAPGTSSNRQETRKQVALRMLYLVANEPQRALQVIPGLPPEEQEFWTALFLGLSEHLDQSAANDPAERATQTIAQLRTAAYHLQQSANLRLRNMTFCQQINGFGNYETFPADQFHPGQTVLIYAEIRNFKSAPTDDGLFVTRIRSTIEIYTVGEGQQLVDRNTFEPTEDRSRTLRTDYYHSYRLDLPAHLTSGPHLIKLILQDDLTGKQTTESINFTVK